MLCLLASNELLTLVQPAEVQKGKSLEVDWQTIHFPSLACLFSLICTTVQPKIKTARSHRLRCTSYSLDASPAHRMKSSDNSQALHSSKHVVQAHLDVL